MQFFLCCFVLGPPKTVWDSNETRWREFKCKFTKCKSLSFTSFFFIYFIFSVSCSRSQRVGSNQKWALSMPLPNSRSLVSASHPARYFKLANSHGRSLFWFSVVSSNFIFLPLNLWCRLRSFFFFFFIILVFFFLSLISPAVEAGT